MKVKYVDNRGYFDDGYYTAKITKIEPRKTNYGQRLLFWFEISNDHNRKMLINDYLPIECTSQNVLSKIYSLTLQKKSAATFDTDELIGKFIGIVLCKKIKKGKTYLNVTNYLTIKEDYTEPSKENASITEKAISQLATILRNNPTLARAIVKEVNKEPKTSRTPKKKKGASPIGKIIEDMKKEKYKN